MILRFVVIYLTLAATGVAVPAAPAAQAQEWYDGPCVDDVGVTVVIDFQELGGGVNVRCAPRSVRSGLDALDAAGIAWEGTLRFPGFVCRIAGKPGTDREACGNTPPASAYWGYWLAARGGTWCYSNLGPANRTPPAGTVEGWSFALDRAPPEVPPPRYAPPPIEGRPSVALNPGDCGAPSPAPPSPTTSPPTTTTRPPTTTTSPPTTNPATTSPPTASPPTTSTSPNDVPTTPPTLLDQAPAYPTTSEPADEQLAPDASAPSTNPAPSTTQQPTPTTRPPRTTAADPTVTTTEPPPTSSLPSTDEEASALAEATGDTHDDAGEAAPLGTVDLGDDGRSGGEFGAGTALGILLIGGLAATATVVTRQRRSSR